MQSTATVTSTEDITDTLTDMSVDGGENVLPDRSISITVKRRPRYSVEINSTTYYCANVDGVVRVMKSHNRTVSTGDVFKSINIKPGHGYRLRERLNGAVVRKMPRP
jgi:hypothetical protein